MVNLGTGDWRLLGLVLEALVLGIVYLLGDGLGRGGCEDLALVSLTYGLKIFQSAVIIQ